MFSYQGNCQNYYAESQSWLKEDGTSSASSETTLGGPKGLSWQQWCFLKGKEGC